MRNIDGLQPPQTQNGSNFAATILGLNSASDQHVLSGDINNSVGVIGLSQQRMSSSNRPVSRDSKVRNGQYPKNSNNPTYQQHRQQVNNFFQFTGGPQQSGTVANATSMLRKGNSNMTSNNFFPSHQLASQNSALLSQTTSSKQGIVTYAQRNSTKNGVTEGQKFDQQMTQNLLR